MFVDMCIMCGTDYNPNIKDVGTVTSFKIISEKTTIDNIKDLLDVKDLNYERVREIFKTYGGLTSTAETRFSKCFHEIDKNAIQEFMFVHNCGKEVFDYFTQYFYRKKF